MMKILLLLFSTAFGWDGYPTKNSSHLTLTTTDWNTLVSLAPASLSGYSLKNRWVAWINNYTEANGTDIQVKITLPSNFPYSTCKSDGTDVRIIDSDNQTILPLYRQTWTVGTTGVFWCKVPKIVANSRKPLFIYYGNSSATDTSSFDYVFTRTVVDQDTKAYYSFDQVTSATVNAVTGYEVSDPTVLALAVDYRYTGSDGGRWGDVDGVTFSRGRALDLAPNYATIHTTGDLCTFSNVVDVWPASGTLSFWFKAPKDESFIGSSVFTFNNAATWPGGSQITNGIHLRRNDAPNDDSYAIEFASTGGSAEDIVLYLTKPLTNLWSHFAMTWDQSQYQIYINGRELLSSYAPHALFPAYNNTLLNFSMNKVFNGDGVGRWQQHVLLDEFKLLKRWSTGPQIQADYWRRKLLTSEQEMWRKDGVVMTCSTASPDQRETGWSMVQEASLLYISGTWYMYYTGNNKIWRSTSSDGVTWTVAPTTQVLGGGQGGEAGAVAHSGLTKIGSTYYLAYCRGGTELKMCTSSDGLTFSGNTTILANPSWVYGGAMGNLQLVQDGSTYILLFDAKATANAQVWSQGLATSSSPASGFAQVQNSPLNTLAGNDFFATPHGHFGGGFLAKVNGVYHIWFHGSGTGDLPSQIYHYYNPSNDFVTWLPFGYQPVVQNTDRGNEVDQVADPWLIEVNGSTYMYYECFDNANHVAKIMRCTYNGTMAQLCSSPTDITAAAQ